MKKIIVGISGATGSIYGVRLLESLAKLQNVETHLVISKWGKTNIELETSSKMDYVTSLADYYYEDDNVGALIASGSFNVDGMVILPCSMKTLSAIANGHADKLMVRAADVMIKEKKKFVIAPRETPLSPIHLENMIKLSTLGVHIMPPMPSFYNKPQTIDDLVNQFVGRVLDVLNIENTLVKRWDGKFEVVQ